MSVNLRVTLLAQFDRNEQEWVLNSAGIPWVSGYYETTHSNCQRSVRESGREILVWHPLEEYPLRLLLVELLHIDASAQAIGHGSQAH